MSNINAKALKKILKDTDIAVMGFPINGSLSYLPYGYQIREKLYNIGIELLKQRGFKPILLSDYIDIDSVKKMDSVTKISHNYYKIEDSKFFMTAGHEVSFYILARQLLKDHSRKYNFPMQFYHFGPVYRSAKNTKYPFNMGERKSFLECYSLHKTSEDAYKAIDVGVEWNREYIQDILHLPCVEVERPLITNKKFSQKSIHTDVITPLGMTTITGMTYFHNDIFTKTLNVKRKDEKDGKNYYVYSNHFGVTEHILFTYLLNAYENNTFKLYSFIAPIQVSVLDLTNNNKNGYKSYNDILNTLKNNNIDFEKEEIMLRDINNKLKTNNMRGIPVTIILKDTELGMEIKLLSCGDELKINSSDLIKTVKKYFKKNDDYIVKKFENRQKSTIVECSTIQDITKIVDAGKIAKIYCENKDEKVLKIEAKIRCGEILGFQRIDRKGIDIVDGLLTNSIAFVSKRS